jgi:hypothetical protein
MIFESACWKEDIAKIAERMKKRKTQKRWPERALVNIEKDVFFAFYAIRKLLEADKLSQTIADFTLNARSYSATGKPVTKMNWHRLDELYDLTKLQQESLALRFICNQIVHSYVFAPSFGEDDALEGILFCSDFKRNEKLYALDVDEIVICLEAIAADSPTTMQGEYDSPKSDFKVVLSTGPAPGKTHT